MKAKGQQRNRPQLKAGPMRSKSKTHTKTKQYYATTAELQRNYVPIVRTYAHIRKPTKQALIQAPKGAWTAYVRRYEEHDRRYVGL